MLKVDHQSGGFTPWNEIYPKKHLSPGIPVIPLWQNSCNLSYAIPLGFTPPVEDTVCGAPWNEICAVSPAPWGMLNIPSEGSIVQLDETIPLGVYNTLNRFTMKLHQLIGKVELF